MYFVASAPPLSVSSGGQTRSAEPRSRSSPLNWSTRLRRWVRIRKPPVRDASTKPIAATVLPAPVACSNQKRLCAFGSSTPSATSSSTSSGGSSSYASASGSSSGTASRSSSSSSSRSTTASRSSSPSSETASSSSSTASTGAATGGGTSPSRWASASSAVRVPDSASTWCGFSVVPSARRGSSSLSTLSRPSSSEYRRRQRVEGT